MSHRDSITEPPPGFEVLAASGGAPVAAMEDRARGFYGVQFHPEVVHTPKGMEVLRNFLYEACGCAPTWTPASIIEESIGKIRAQVGEQQGHPRPLRRRRLVGGRAAHAQGHRRPPHLRLRRPRHDAHARGRAVVETFSGHLRHPAGRRRRQRPVPRQAQGRHRPRAQAQDHRRGVHPLLRGGGAQAHRREVPRAGHALPRRHRERHAGRPPRSRATTTSAACPRRWTSSWSSRCAGSSRTRCAPWARSWGCRSTSSGGSPSPAPASPSASSARSRASASTSCSAPTPSCRRRSAAPASTASSGSASPSCRSSAASACRATSAPTATPSPSAR